ncbi:MAG: capsular biosynthesis protein [Saccharospirillaceae bacterium]|nr:capsular biosynthesis protein [Saccharospirillaceae bacterium]MCD8530406.1 capsular biosynthesis protein [Saccharospirillaceae bacterium]
MAVLFLQGPMGPFFKQLILALREQGVVAHKINFNGGDSWYSRGIGAVNFTGSVEQWPDFLRTYIRDHKINTVCVYGDCRLYHRIARQVTSAMDVGFYAFEEGYIRPNHLTFERDGVNGYSGISAERIACWQDKDVEPELAIGGHLWNRVRYCSAYYNVAAICHWRFRHYQHHRSFSPVYEAACWLLAGARHYLYKLTERGKLKQLVRDFDQRYFLLPLQVFNDAQIRFHSPYESVAQCIEEVITSFSEHADPQDCLVIKHHPMDRGHIHYGDLIRQLERRYGLAGRLLYCHDLHLPTLLTHAKGVITINSTTAISAFYHEASVKVLGDAFYNIPGICSQQSLQEFWQKPAEIDYDLFLRFRNYLSHNGQINGSFYRRHAFTVERVIEAMRENGIL